MSSTLSHANGNIILNDNSATIFGREDLEHLLSPDELNFVSRKAKGGHFEIIPVKDTNKIQYFIRDLGSRNGTYVNSNNISNKGRVELRKGDIITLGDMTKFQFNTVYDNSETHFSSRVRNQNDFVRPASKSMELGYNQKYCSYCGGIINNQAEICLHCGVKQNKEAPVELKSSGMAAVLSFFIPGLGQIYNGEIAKGLVILFIIMPIAVFTIILGIGLIIAPLVWIICIFDAYNGAKRINEKQR